MTRYWFLDCDETLVQSSYSWGMKVAFPNLMERHQLQFDRVKIEHAMNVVLQQTSDKSDILTITTAFFKELDWSNDWVNELLDDFRTNFKPSLFDDTIPFLEKLKKQNEVVSVISNNVHATNILKEVSIDAYMDYVITPSICGCEPKPHISLWNYVKKVIPNIDIQNCIMIGNDKKIDGLFADRCGIHCCIIDRNRNSNTHPQDNKYQWVSSLLEISV